MRTARCRTRVSRDTDFQKVTAPGLLGPDGRMRCLVLSVALACAAPVTGAAEPTGVTANTDPSLPFDRQVINRYSLNGRPRSLSLRQGEDVWLGYDLEQAKPFKVWQAPAGKPGLSMRGFVARSEGVTWFEDATSEG